MSFCDCGCALCRKRTGLHESCSWECVEAVPSPPVRRRVLGGKPGREIIAID